MTTTARQCVFRKMEILISQVNFQTQRQSDSLILPNNQFLYVAIYGRSVYE